MTVIWAGAGALVRSVPGRRDGQGRLGGEGDDEEVATASQRRNVLYAYGPEKLIIGRYCAIASRNVIRTQHGAVPTARR
jgi:hypothetical protein